MDSMPPSPPPPPPPMLVTTAPERAQSLGKKKQKELQFKIVQAIEREDLSAVRRLIGEGTELNCTIVFNKTPLTYAIEKKNFAMAKLMVQSGANVNLGEPYANAYQPLHMAVRVGSYDMTEYLLQNGAHVNGSNGCGMTPVMFASHHGHLEMVEMLHAQGADLNAEDSVGKTSLHRAVEGQHASVVQFLLSKGVNINTADKFGRTALYHSISFRHLDMIDLLITSGSSVRGKDWFGLSPLKVALFRPCDHNIRALISTAADYHVCCKGVLFPEIRELIQSSRSTSEEMVPVDLAILQRLVNRGGLEMSNIRFVTKSGKSDSSIRAPLWQYLILCKHPYKPERLSNQAMSMQSRSVKSHCLVNSCSLQCRCRLAVRGCLERKQPCDIRASVIKLPIPNHLKNYLNLADYFDAYPQFSHLYKPID